MTTSPMMRDARAKTLAFVKSLSDEHLCAWPDADFSPLCWHLGHVAFTEAQWALEQCTGDSTLSAPFAQRFAQNGCQRARRAEGYDRGELFAYMDEVRGRVEIAWPRIEEHPLGTAGYLDWFLACHEHQHCETMALVLALSAVEDGARDVSAPALTHCATTKSAFGGRVVLGTNERNAYDNERPEHAVEIPGFQLSDAPVRAAEWAEFMKAGGYETESLWCTDGWAFRQRLRRAMPRAWRRADEGFVIVGASGVEALTGDEAVWGISWYEANAYARWAGASLPTEAEWELAAHQGLRETGQVWEWCACEFAPRPGFEPHPYRGYSEPYFDGKHRVLRGGSFATDPAIARPRFRNWFAPETRQVFAGLRLRWPA